METVVTISDAQTFHSGGKLNIKCLLTLGMCDQSNESVNNTDDSTELKLR